MSLLFTFMELDKLYEATLSRQDLINHIKASGRQYNFENKTTAQLFRIWERIQSECQLLADTAVTTDRKQTDVCNNCGIRLNDSGTCPICDDGEEDMFEWIDINGNQAKTNTGTTGGALHTQTIPTKQKIVTIVYDSSKHKLGAQADDGIHGVANVAFPNNLRTHSGQQYEVETLIWNGKNYRVSGNIKSI